MQYIRWRLQQIAGVFIAIVLYPVKLLLFLPVLMDRGIDYVLYRIGK
jgi:hypothetical protein